MRWPIPAFLTWGGAWLLFRLLSETRVPVSGAFAMASGVGALCIIFGSTLWRKAAIAAGFPLSYLLTGNAVMPAWAWLLPLLLILLVYPIGAWRDAPVFPTPTNALADVPRHIRLAQGAAVLDAGCGLGHGLRALRLAFPEARLFGIEWSWPLRAITGLTCPWANIRQGDIWQADWSEYDLVYLFQRPESMTRAVAKAGAELKPGAWLVSLAFEATELQATARVQTVDNRPVWLYQQPFRSAPPH